MSDDSRLRLEQQQLTSRLYRTHGRAFGNNQSQFIPKPPKKKVKYIKQ
jgi:hypothetical protein